MGFIHQGQDGPRYNEDDRKSLSEQEVENINHVFDGTTETTHLPDIVRELARFRTASPDRQVQVGGEKVHLADIITAFEILQFAVEKNTAKFVDNPSELDEWLGMNGVSGKVVKDNPVLRAAVERCIENYVRSFKQE